ncbi:MAG: TatD family hydrolase [Clostridia bacterium]|nr:TatD family hydrolase [Clostridia bacterium]
MIDVHAHFDDARFDEDRAEALAALPAAGVTRLINSGSTHASCERALELTRQYDFIYASIGIYPHDTMELENGGMKYLREMAQQPKVVAIGEIGLDYYYDGTPKPIQQKWFHQQLELAEELKLPVVIHSRDAIRDTLEILRQHPNNTGIFHCYSGSVESLREVVELGWSISMGGVVTFKNSRVTKEVAAAVPADRLMLETDSPYLAPVPYRGKRNTSAYLPEVMAEIARLRGATPEEIERITDENACRMFKLK